MSEYEPVGPVRGYHDSEPEKQPETIRERIDREIAEEKAAGSARHAARIPTASAEFASGGIVRDTKVKEVIEDTVDGVLAAEYARGYNDGQEAQKSQRAAVLLGEITGPLPGPWTSKAIEDVTKVLGARGHSYTVDQEFENFIEQAKVGEQTLRQVFRGAIGQKLTRERSVRKRIEELYAVEHEMMEARPELEGLYLQWLDSIRDICGYGLLFFGWAKSQVEDQVEDDDPR